MSEDYIAGRSLFAEITHLREDMEAIRKAFLLLVELQKEANTKLNAALSVNTIHGGGVAVEDHLHAT
jgi:hypothetical protein